MLYDYFIESILDSVGDANKTTFLDVGCNTGYFPLSFSRLKAKRASGCDREKNFAEVFGLLNDILGTQATFFDSWYDSQTHRLSKKCKPYDVVVSMAVLCHLSDPLNHLNLLGSLANKAVFLWTLVNKDAGYTIHLGEPRRDYKDDRFPVCFDNKTCLSDALIHKSFELMGFKNIIELPQNGRQLPAFGWDGYELKAYLALR